MRGEVIGPTSRLKEFSGIRNKPAVKHHYEDWNNVRPQIYLELESYLADSAQYISDMPCKHSFFAVLDNWVLFDLSHSRMNKFYKFGV